MEIFNSQIKCRESMHKHVKELRATTFCTQSMGKLRKQVTIGFGFTLHWIVEILDGGKKNV